MYQSLQLPWSPDPSPEETAYRNASENMVRTQGTVFLLPPDRQVLVESFNAPPRPKTRMSAGAVALCKHFERGGASSEHGRPHPFWPWPKGSNEHKTELAAGVLDNVLGNVRWENVLMLHSYVAIYEVRNSRGFGLRWTLNLEGRDSTPSDVQLATSAANDKGSLRTTMTDDKVPSGAGTAERGLGGEDEKEEEEEKAAPAASALIISKVVFRGFVEPILDQDHELPES
ncbi:hypothetical protein PG993_014215 [Apiospora rasikravindrae]|uniref:Uncharacterized protein n=1 Tax=Apiospora rasikravindrae TaxID=990691 RepID=A0ABR1RSE7_9PEZI